MDRSTALDRMRGIARTGFSVGWTVAGQAGKAAVGISKGAVAAARDVADRRRTARGTAAPAPREPAPATPAPPPVTPTADPEAAVTSDIDAGRAGTGPNPADVARVVAKKPRPTRPPATPARKKAAKKSVPGAKLPPRRPE